MRVYIYIYIYISNITSFCSFGNILEGGVGEYYDQRNSKGLLDIRK
jgi:hypothetical protein